MHHKLSTLLIGYEKGIIFPRLYSRVPIPIPYPIPNYNKKKVENQIFQPHPFRSQMYYPIDYTKKPTEFAIKSG